MTTYIGQASCDERGKYVGGQAGNQSGTELNIREAYLRSWHTLIRFKDANRALKCGQAARAAVGNMHIGYDQNERNTLLPAAREVGFDLSRVSRNVETDCSALAGVCGIAAGAPESIIYAGGNLCWTGDIESKFRQTGLVDVYKSSDYVSSTAKWQTGDIIVSNTHTIIVTNGLTPTGASGGTSSVDGTIDELAQAVIAGRYGDGETRRTALGDKYDAVQARVNEILRGAMAPSGGTSGGGTVSESVPAGCYVINVNDLRIRHAPSTSAYAEPSVTYNRGNAVVLDGWSTVADGYVWGRYIGASSGQYRYIAVRRLSTGEAYASKI